jgi:sugar (pentulose or hexulose) kinase
MHSASFNLFIDFGASYTKIRVTDRKNVIHLEKRFQAPHLSRAGFEGEFATYDPIEYASHARKIFHEAEDAFGTFENVAVSGQVATYILLDDSNLPVTPIISWQDRSSEFSSKSLEFRRNNEEFLKEIGDEDGLRSGLPAISLISYLPTNKELFHYRRKYVPLNNFLLSHLSQSTYPIERIHSSEAHASGLFSALKREWKAVTDLVLEYQELVFPEVTFVPENYRVANARTNFWLPIGDQQAAVYGLDVEPGTNIIHIATGGQVIKQVDELIPNLDSSFQVRPTLSGEGLLTTVTHLPAGRLFNRIFSYLTAESKKDVNWDSLEDIRDSAISLDIKPIDVISINQGTIKLPSLRDFDDLCEAYLVSLLVGVSNIYRSKLSLLPNSNFGDIAFSGGLLTKSEKLKFTIKLGLPERNILMQPDSDTSLNGLNKMIKQAY